MSYIQENHTRKIETPPEIAEGTNGEPAYVMMRTRAKNKTYRVFTKMREVNGELSAALIEIEQMDLALAEKEDKKLRAQREKKVTEAEKIMDRLNELTEQVYRAYVYFVAGWNWKDFETGEALPQPTERSVFEDELSPQQIAWIREQIEETKTFRATEGNGMSSSPS